MYWKVSSLTRNTQFPFSLETQLICPTNIREEQYLPEQIVASSNYHKLNPLLNLGIYLESHGCEQITSKEDCLNDSQPNSYSVLWNLIILYLVYLVYYITIFPSLLQGIKKKLFEVDFIYRNINSLYYTDLWVSEVFFSIEKVLQYCIFFSKLYYSYFISFRQLLFYVL